MDDTSGTFPKAPLPSAFLNLCSNCVVPSAAVAQVHVSPSVRPPPSRGQGSGRTTLKPRPKVRVRFHDVPAGTRAVASTSGSAFRIATGAGSQPNVSAAPSRPAPAPALAPSAASQDNTGSMPADVSGNSQGIALPPPPAASQDNAGSTPADVGGNSQGFAFPQTEGMEMQMGFHQIGQQLGLIPPTAPAFPWGGTPKAPADAPKTIKFPAQIEKEWSQIWTDTYAEHDRQLKADITTAPPLTENGATVEADDYSGDLANKNIGGLERDPTQFEPDLTPVPGYRAVGIFHLHDYPAKSESCAVDGGDALAMMKYRQSFVVARSGKAHDGPTEYMFVRTATTPDLPENAQDITQKRTDDLQKQNHMSFNDATRQAAREFAQQYNLVYYEGSNGTFQRKYP